MAQTVLAVAPRVLKLLESFLSQWDQMDSITVDLRREATAVTLAVLPGRQVRIRKVMTGLPVLAFRGSTKVLAAGDTATDETVVAFEPADEASGVELRFEGILYGLVRLFAFPLDSGRIREIRVFAKTRHEGRQVINVAVIMEATRDKKDPRRMIVVQDAREKRIVRGAFAVESVTDKKETTVSYITPARRYTYQRIKGADGQ
jgi:hypothetical protein